jgi:glycosyltransferase involved in cell wall biosynthesis
MFFFNALHLRDGTLGSNSHCIDLGRRVRHGYRIVTQNFQSTVPIVAVTGGLLLGGSTTFLLNLTQGLRNCGQNLTILSLSEPNEHAADAARVGAQVDVADSRRLIYEDRLLWAYEKLAVIRPQMVLACLGGDSFELLRVVPPGVVRAGIIQSHDAGPYETARRYAHWIDVMIGVSEKTCCELRTFAEFGETDIAHIPYGISFSPPPERRLRSPGEPLRVIYVGRLIEEQKRISRLVQLIRSVSGERADIEFTLVGGGPLEAQVRVQLAGLPRVVITGALPNSQIPSLLREHDVFILLSDYEGLPLSLLEAMGAGVVPIVSDLESGIRDVVAESCGIRVPVGDVSAAAEALRRLAKDPAELFRQGQAAMDLARNRFSAERMAQSYLNLLPSMNGVAPAWPHLRSFPPPLGVARPWLFRGGARLIRRWLKGAIASVRTQSSRE